MGTCRKPYSIVIPGDDYAYGEVELSIDELAVVKRVINSLHADGPYASIPRIIDIEAEEKRHALALEREREENAKQLDRAMGLGPTKTAMEIAFEKALHR